MSPIDNGLRTTIGSRTDRDVLTQLERANEDLNILIEQVGFFVDWWSDLITSLVNLKEILPQIENDGIQPFRAEAVKERWLKVHNDYVEYRRQVRHYRCVRHDMLTKPTFTDQ